MNLKECEQLCLRNCSCTAYANLNIEGNGCLLWFANLIDINEFSQGGQDLYVRVAASDLDNVERIIHSNKKKLVGIIVGCGILIISMLMLGLFIYKRRDSRRKRGMTMKMHDQDYRNGQRKEDVDLTTFDFRTITNATNNFSSDNKLGEGGFGPVYKATLMGGQDIAVKRLSVNSGLDQACFALNSDILFDIGTSTSLDTIAPSQSIRDGETLVSDNGTFELGFFSPGNSKTRYLGIWYKLSPLTVTWVANRGKPLNNTFGVLQVNDQGVLVLQNGTGSNSTVWESSVSKQVDNPIAQLLESGNLVVREGNNYSNILWQSFDYPCDTLLPGMKLGWNLVTGQDWFLSSWKSEDDPDHGDYSFEIDRRGYPQAVQLKGTVITNRAGPWNGLAFSANPIQKLVPQFKSEFVWDEEEIFYEFQVLDKSDLIRYMVTPSGYRQLFHWTSETSNWELVWSQPSVRCDNYALCGANSICNSNSTPECACAKGFEPKYPGEWNMSYWSNGCVRMIPLSCSKDGFMKYTGMVLPDTSSSRYIKTMMSLKECEDLCVQNCSCTAYAILDQSGGGTVCLLWSHDLIDMRQSLLGAQDIYIRVPDSELDHNQNKELSKKQLAGIITGSTLFIMCIVLGLAICVWKKKLKKPGMTKIINQSHHNHKLRKEDLDLPTFDLPIIAKATDNFLGTNKLGEGGFGPVYKGTLIDGQDIAVKRLSKNSCQGLEEFKNEVALIAKLQHRNLVKLLGYYIQGEEKMLIYEYMPNKSLDCFIFDDIRSKLLDWCKRFHIIGGIARGLLYLHQDSRLRIIHRDLKTSNILLDENMNPKISDFGLARIFWGDQVEANTDKVAGTYGYMPPEYAVHGHFSMKSDVFGFGVIVLEIISGKKNRGYSDPEHFLNLLGHAWTLWTEERPLKLMDTFLGETHTPSEVIRCIHVGLLCVQERPEDRPDMSAVVLMLNGEKLLPQPKAPGFYTGRDIPEADSLSEKFKMLSNNDISLTDIEAR